jgi:hypothetical protein
MTERHTTVQTEIVEAHEKEVSEMNEEWDAKFAEY